MGEAETGKVEVHEVETKRRTSIEGNDETKRKKKQRRKLQYRETKLD